MALQQFSSQPYLEHLNMTILVRSGLENAFVIDDITKPEEGLFQSCPTGPRHFLSVLVDMYFLVQLKPFNQLTFIKS